MKFKNLYSSRIRNSAIQKLISSSLAVGLIFNSVSISFASILSDDGRYETFEGSNITINDILEEDKVDVEIKGNTMVNVLNHNKIIRNDGWTYDVNERRGYVNLVSSSSAWTELNFDTDKNIELDKEYTVFMNVTKNTLVRNDNTSNDRVVKIAISSDTGDGNTFFVKHNQTGIIKHVITPSENVSRKPYISIIPNVGYGEFEFKDFMVIEGNYMDKNISYFDGMKSVGEDESNNHKMEITSQNKNLILLNKIERGVVSGKTTTGNVDTRGLENMNVDVDNNTIECTTSTEWQGFNTGLIKINPKNEYSIKFDKNKFDINDGEIGINYCLYDSNKRFVKQGYEKVVNPTLNTRYIRISFYSRDAQSFTIGNPILQNTSDDSSYTAGLIDKKEIILKEPLRALSNGVKDKIIKRNGQWVIERNFAEIILDGDENWKKANQGYNDSITTFWYETKYIDNSLKSKQMWLPKQSGRGVSDKFNWIGDELYYNTVVNEGFAQGHLESASTDKWYIAILNNRLSSIDVNGFKQWLKNNPIKIVYELANPIYESLNIDSTVNTYLDTTYISNNSIVPPSIKVTIDRVVNRAVEAIELAKVNPTITNLSLARMWTNKLKETIKKDELNNQINNILDIDDLQLEKKKVTSNIDVYIKSENMLLMSLSTNSITFNDYSGVEDVELSNVVNISINSSLPYQLNSYLLSEIENSDKSNRIEKDLLNIKVSKDSDYKTFNNINEKLILEDDCIAGNNKSHSIDLKLKGSQAHKADIYKTVIKFEAEQK